MEELLLKVFDGVLDGNRANVEAGVNEAIAAGLAHGRILDESLIAATECVNVFETTISRI